jgi:hypothetical protein
MRVRIGVIGFLAIATGVAACGRSHKAAKAEPSPVSSAAPNAIYMKYGSVEGESTDGPKESTALNTAKLTPQYSKQTAPNSYPTQTKSDGGTIVLKPPPTAPGYPIKP